MHFAVQTKLNYIEIVCLTTASIMTSACASKLTWEAALHVVEELDMKFLDVPIVVVSDDNTIRPSDLMWKSADVHLVKIILGYQHDLEISMDLNALQTLLEQQSMSELPEELRLLAEPSIEYKFHLAIGKDENNKYFVIQQLMFDDKGKISKAQKWIRGEIYC